MLERWRVQTIMRGVSKVLMGLGHALAAPIGMIFISDLLRNPSGMGAVERWAGCAVTFGAVSSHVVWLSRWLRERVNDNSA
jgi:hypothetical protein